MTFKDDDDDVGHSEIKMWVEEGLAENWELNDMLSDNWRACDMIEYEEEDLLRRGWEEVDQIIEDYLAAAQPPAKPGFLERALRALIDWFFHI